MSSVVEEGFDQQEDDFGSTDDRRAGVGAQCASPRSGKPLGITPDRVIGGVTLKKQGS